MAHKPLNPHAFSFQPHIADTMNISRKTTQTSAFVCRHFFMLKHLKMSRWTHVADYDVCRKKRNVAKTTATEINCMRRKSSHKTIPGVSIDGRQSVESFSKTAQASLIKSSVRLSSRINCIWWRQKGLAKRETFFCEIRDRTDENYDNLKWSSTDD